MPLDKTLLEAIAKIDNALAEYDLSNEDRTRIHQVLEKSLISVVEEVTDSHNQAAVSCCGPEADLAHKIADEIERKNKALIANLMALR